MVKGRQKLSDSREMYLKTIYELSRKGDTVMAKDVAWQLGVSKPSVTRALKKLGAEGYIHYAPYEAVSLTAKGERIGRGIVKRFAVLERFFQASLQLPRKDASEMACVLEHAVPEKVMHRFVKLLEFMESCSRGRVAWREAEQSFACEPEVCQQEDCVRFARGLQGRDKLH